MISTVLYIYYDHKIEYATNRSPITGNLVLEPDWNISRKEAGLLQITPEIIYKIRKGNLRK